MQNKINISIIIPIRDEEKNIPIIFSQIPRLLNNIEAIFVEGNSRDSSWEIAKGYNQRRNKHQVLFRTVKQIGKGKGNAVRTGFNKAKGDYLIIYDGDMTIPMNYLQRFIKKIQVYQQKKKEVVIIGDRLSKKREQASIKPINYLGNIFFAVYYSFLLKSKIVDCCCGTKALSKKLWRKIETIRKKEGDLDSWGDIDLMYYGRRSGANIDSVKVFYRKRLFGKSKMQSWRLGLNMFFIGLIILRNNFFGKKYE